MEKKRDKWTRYKVYSMSSSTGECPLCL